MTTTAIIFGSITVISSTEGGWQEPEIGTINPSWDFKSLAQADGELANPLNRKGCQHKVVVNFVNVPIASIQSIRDRMDSLTRAGKQTLKIAEWPDIPNCVCEEAPLTSSRRCSISRTIATYGQSVGRDLDFTLTFHQLW